MFLLIIIKMSQHENEWFFYPNKDSFSNDITFYQNKTIDELIAISDLYPNCVAFNTYGFFKHSITPEDKFIDISDKFNSPDGLFVKKFKGIKNLYNQPKINDIVLKVSSPNIDKKITFSITTCKRFDLFEKTMNSFIHYCKDVLLIDEYICVDDNSSEEDREKMKTLYPFFKFIMKTPEQKGHIQSMNIIINEVKTPYLIHMEDDWQFYVEGNYITEALNIINQTNIISIYNIPENQNINNKKIAQVLFNKNYTEIEEEIVNGGYLCITDDGYINYLIHEHYDEKTNPNDYLQSCLKNGRSCVYWPHYSLRPSLLNTEIFKTLGYFTDKFGFFEREYAERFFKNNYISCFFDKVICRHIGKLTSEKNGINAYNLNNVDQFSYTKNNETEKKITNSEILENKEILIQKELKDLFDKWIFIKGLDFNGGDIGFIQKDMFELNKIVYNNQSCNAFNTLGFIKGDIDINKLVETPWINGNTEHGIFIKKNYFEKINNVDKKIQNIDKKYCRIKLMCNWKNSKQLCDEWNVLTNGNYIWNNIQFTWDNFDIDYYVIINNTNEYYEPSKTIFFHMEPWVFDEKSTWGVKTWGIWSKPDENKFLQVRSHNNFINNCIWELNSFWKDLNNFVTKDTTKNNKISIICSPKYFDPGHIKRIDFLKFLEAKNDSDVIIDIYSSSNFCNFKNYAGKCPKDNKNIGIRPYKYYFMVENNNEYNYITEKLWEPILSECLCFYSGCPNVSDYIDERAFVQLDMNDFEKSFQIIKNAINDNLWEKRLPYIQNEKQKILNHYAFCPTLERIIGYHTEYKKYFGEKFKNINNVSFIHCPKNIDTLYYFIKCFNESKILDKIDFVFIINYGNQLNINKFTDDKIKIINLSSDVKSQENNTLALLQIFSNFHSNANILYLHTKENYYDKTKQNILDWINMMLYFNVYKFQDCLEYLTNFDTIGCNLKKTSKPYYFGNFWWAKTNYINKLFKIKNNIDAEKWILEGKNVKAKEIFNSNVNHLVEEYSEELYINV